MDVTNENQIIIIQPETYFYNKLYMVKVIIKLLFHSIVMLTMKNCIFP